MGIGDKFRKVFNIDSDYYDDYEDEDEGIEMYNGSRGGDTPQRRPTAPQRTERHTDAARQPSYHSSSKVVDIHTTAKLQVVLKKPEHFDEAPTIADELLERRTVVLNLEATAKDEAGRLLCFLSGVAYANGGKLKKIANNTYIITPYNVDVMGDLLDELENNGMFFM